MLKGYRTIIFNVIMTALMLLKMWVPDAELPEGEEVSAAIDNLDLAITFFWGLGNLILRLITNTPIGQKR